MRIDDADADLITAEITRAAALPLEDASTLPPDAYRSEAFLAREVERIFRREWLFAGRVDEIPNEGDYFSFEIAGEPLLVLRGYDRHIHAFSAVCRHRFSRLKDDRGNTRSFQCPYHAWTYDLNGRLIGAPFMEKTRGFNRQECRLPEFRVEIWAGFIYVSLNNEAEPLAPRLRGLDDKISDYRLGEMKTVIHEIEVWNANWKMVAENAMECYHLFQVHKDTINPYSPTSGITVMPGGEGYNINNTPLYNGLTGYDDARAKDLNPKLNSEQLHTFWIIHVYPSQFIGVMGDSVFWINEQPIDASHSVVRFGLAQLGAIPDRDTDEGRALREEVKTGFDSFNRQDKTALSAVQKGVTALHAAVGRLSNLEWPLWEFNRYLARMLAGRNV
jgi:choline monooxygenase